MSNVLLYIDGVNRTEYFKGPLRVSPGGDGQIGSATIHLDQEAGGLDLRPMMDVRVYVPFSTTANTGIAPKGRLFAGVIAKRQTTNIGNTKIWDLPCWDYSVILKKSYRRAASAYTVTLSADTLAQQIIELFGILQGATPTTFLDVTNYVADLYPTMPAVTYPGGHTWEWYLIELLKTVHVLDPAVFPGFYMGVGTTFGAIDTFGSPVLNVYDKAAPPVSVFTFSDTPSGGEKSVFEFFARDTDATGLSQYQQSWWNGAVYTATDATSISNYPNPYDDHIGAWVDGEVIDDTQSASADEAQALVDNVVLAKGSPRDSIKFGTYERVMPGEYIDLEWTLEGIPAATQYRIATAAFEWEEPDTIYTTVTLNTRRLGLFDDGLEGYFAAPVEGDHVPPNPPADLDVTSNTYNALTGRAELIFDIDNTGASPDTAGYRIRGTVGGLYVSEDVGLDLAPMLSFAPNSAYSFRVWAYDYEGNISETYPAPLDPAITGTTAFPSVYDVLNGGFEETDPADSTKPRYWTRTTATGGTATLTTVAAEGLKAAKLSTTGSLGSLAGLTCDYVVARSITTRNNPLRLMAKANTATTLKYSIYYYDSALAQIGSPTTGTKTLTTTYVEYSIVVANVATAAYMKFYFYSDTLNRDVYLDGVRFKQQTITDDLEDDIITGDKIPPTLTLTDQTINLTSTAKITGGSKITLDVSGIKSDGTSGGTGAFDFYNEVGVRIGRIYSAGTVNNGALAISADYNGSGNTGININSEDEIALGVAATGNQILMNATHNLHETGSTSRPHKFDSGSVVIGGGLTDPATDGYLYIPQIDTTPSGTPTSQGATNPMCYDESNRRLYVYDFAASIWRQMNTTSLPSGTSFPGSPSSGDTFYRTDLNVWARYDGTRWLGEENPIPMHNYLGSPPFSSTIEVLATSIRSDRALYLTRFAASFYCGGGVDGSNYWDVKLRRFTAGAGSVDTMCSIRTTGQGWDKVAADVTSFSNNPLNTTDIVLQVYIEKTGSPNAIYLQAATFGRLVYT